MSAGATGSRPAENLGERASAYMPRRPRSCSMRLSSLARRSLAEEAFETPDTARRTPAALSWAVCSAAIRDRKPGIQGSDDRIAIEPATGPEDVVGGRVEVSNAGRLTVDARCQSGDRAMNRLAYDPGINARLPLQLREQLLASERCDDAPAATLVTGLGPEGQSARDGALAGAGRAFPSPANRRRRRFAPWICGTSWRCVGSGPKHDGPAGAREGDRRAWHWRRAGATGIGSGDAIDARWHPDHSARHCPGRPRSGLARADRKAGAGW